MQNKLSVLPTIMNEQAEQQQAIDLALQGKSFFLTGAAGTGKTFTLKTIVNKLKNAGKRVGVTASTALAASHFDDSMEACTLHKLAGVKYDGSADGNGFGVIDVLVIDEISMIGHTLFETIEETARKTLHSDLPMGGIQVIGCGDFYQLSPVESSYCFESRKWRHVFPNFVVLKTVCRQDNLEFINILNKVRIGDTTGVKEFIDAHCKRTNSDDFIYLYAQNNDVDSKNKARLKLLTTPKIKYIARDTELYSTLDTQHRAPEELELSVGCPVVVTHNVDANLYNGLRGKIVGFTGDQPTANQRYFIGCNELSCPIVNFNGRIKAVKPFQFKETFNNECYREQIPLTLNWAMTIHKAQGMSLDGCNIDLKGAFQLGQVYVALSRIRDPRQMFVNNFSPRDVRISDAVEAYYEGLKPFKMLPGEELDEDDTFEAVKIIYYGVTDAELNVPGSHGDLETDVISSVSDATGLVGDSGDGDIGERGDDDSGDDDNGDDDRGDDDNGDSDSGEIHSVANIHSHHGVIQSDGDSDGDSDDNSDGDSDENSDGESDDINRRVGHSDSNNRRVGHSDANNRRVGHSDANTLTNPTNDHNDANTLRNRRLANLRNLSFAQKFGRMAVIDISDSDDDHTNETYRAGTDANQTYRSYFDREPDRETYRAMTATNGQRKRAPIFISDSEDSEDAEQTSEHPEDTSDEDQIRVRRPRHGLYRDLRRHLVHSPDSEDYMN